MLTEIGKTLLIGKGRSKLTPFTFARPARPRSKSVRMLARALWMRAEEEARRRVGMVVVG